MSEILDAIATYGPMDSTNWKLFIYLFMCIAGLIVSSFSSSTKLPPEHALKKNFYHNGYFFVIP